MQAFIEFLKNNEFLIKLAMAAAELAIGLFLAPVIRNLIMKTKVKGVDPTVLSFTSSAAAILVKILAVVIALGQIGVDMSVVVGAFSAVGLGVSLALKESMANVAGGMQILITKPFSVGDYIAMGEYEGTCRQVEIMFTVLETVNRQEVVIPNSQLVSNPLINYSHYPVRRIAITVPVSVNADYSALRSSFQQLMESNSRILKDPIPKTVINGFNQTGTGVEIRLVCYTDNSIYWDVLYQLNEQVQMLMTKQNVRQPLDLIQVVQPIDPADIPDAVQNKSDTPAAVPDSSVQTEASKNRQSSVSKEHGPLSSVLSHVVSSIQSGTIGRMVSLPAASSPSVQPQRADRIQQSAAKTAGQKAGSASGSGSAAMAARSDSMNQNSADSGDDDAAAAVMASGDQG